jgi:hypothetical protein
LRAALRPYDGLLAAQFPQDRASEAGGGADLTGDTGRAEIGTFEHRTPELREAEVGATGAAPRPKSPVSNKLRRVV